MAIRKYFKLSEDKEKAMLEMHRFKSKLEGSAGLSAGTKISFTTCDILSESHRHFHVDNATVYAGRSNEPIVITARTHKDIQEARLTIKRETGYELKAEQNGSR